jgi:4'-phosphopantetheinyl transferase
VIHRLLEASEIPAIGPGECHVFWARRTHCGSGHRHLMNSIERDRQERYLRASDRDRFTVGVVLTKLILGSQLNIAAASVPLDRTCGQCGQPHGRPRLTSDAGLAFSVSHSGNLIAMAVVQTANDEHGMVGVDVEQVTARNVEELADAVLSPDERIEFNSLNTAARQSAFFRYWVRKEAVLKATGEGLAAPMAQLTVSGPTRRPALRDWGTLPGFSRQVALHDLGAAPGYHASLAVIGSQPRVLEWDASGVVRAALRPAPCWPVRSSCRPGR